MTENEVKIGCASLPKSSNYQSLTNVDLHLEDYPVLESLLLCIQNNWLAILVGEGKTEDLSRNVQLLAGLLGQNLHCLTLSSSSDTSELLGGFEQTSDDIVISALKNELVEIIESEIDNPKVKKMELISLKEGLSKFSNLTHLKEMISDLTLRLSGKSKEKLKNFSARIEQMGDLNEKVAFDWIDSILVKAIEKGDWVVLSDANLCNPSVLDRLNSLMEENGTLAIGEKGCRNGMIPEVKPHPGFRLFLTMDPRDGELSPAMRNRGIEIYIEKSSESMIPEDIIPGDLLVKFDRPFMISKQFSMVLNHFEPVMKDRALLAFMSCDFQDWKLREHFCKLVLQKNFKHPASNSAEILTESSFLCALEYEFLAKMIQDSSGIKFAKADDRFLWQCLGKIAQNLSHCDYELSNNWLQLSMIYAFMMTIKKKIAQIDDVAVMWKNLRPIFVKLLGDGFQFLEEVDKMLARKTNGFEILALDFNEKRFGSDLQIKHGLVQDQKALFQIQNLHDIYQDSKLEIYPVILEKIFKIERSFGSQMNFKHLLNHMNDLMSINNFLSLLETETETPILVRDDVSSLMKMFPKCQDIITLESTEKTLKVLNDIIKLLEKNKTNHYNFIDHFSEVFKTLSISELEKCSQSVNSELPMSANALKVFQSPKNSNDALNLFKTGLLTIYIAGERSEVDVSDQMLIEGQVKCDQVEVLNNDIIAYDSCQALIALDQDQFSSDPVQVSRRNMKIELNNEMEILEKKRPIRNPEEKYADLISELNQLKQGPLAFETLESLIHELEQMRSVEKCNSWLRSITPFMFNVPFKYRSYQDVWFPFIFGCAQVVLGIIQHKKICALLKLRNADNVIENFDQMRSLLRFDTHKDVKDIREMSEMKDNQLLDEDFPMNLHHFLDTFTGNVIKGHEQKLVFQLFQDHLTTEKNKLRNNQIEKMDLLKIVQTMIKFITEKFQVPDIIDDENEDDIDPFIVDTLKALNTCLSRPIEEPHEKAMVPLENVYVTINEKNKNAVSHLIIPLKDLETMLIQWRRNGHSWLKMDDKMSKHLFKGVEICLKSLKSFLKKPQKKRESLVIPFVLFCHNSFLGDFEMRLNHLRFYLSLFEQEEEEVAGHLRTVLAFFDGFKENCLEVLRKRKRELKMKFDVQIKSNKRLYEETNIRNHFKNANSIVRSSSRALGELCLSQSRTHHTFKDEIMKVLPFNQTEFSTESASDNAISDDIKISELKFTKALKSSSKLSSKLGTDLNQILTDWRDDVISLAKDINENKAKKFTFHVIKTKSSNMITNLKDLGLSKSLGSTIDAQLFKIVQCIQTSSKSPKVLSLSLLQATFTLERLSSSLLLPISAKSKAFTFCRNGQDLVSHGILILLKSCQNLIKNHQYMLDSQALLKKLNSTTSHLNMFEIHRTAQKCLTMTKICMKMGSLPSYDQLSHICSEIATIKGSLNCTFEKWLQQLDIIKKDPDLHPNVHNALMELIAVLSRNANLTPKDEIIDEPLKMAFEQAAKQETKVRFLALQTVIKKIKLLKSEESPLEALKEMNTCMDILDIESFNIGLQALIQMKQSCPLPSETTLIFQACLNFWSGAFNFAQDIFIKSNNLLKNISETLLMILDYKYSEGKEEEEEQESQDAGEKQEGCGLGDDTTEGGEATTKDVESEDIFDSAEKPNQEKEEKNEEENEEKEKKEEDGFEVDNVQDDNPQAPDEDEEGQDDDSEDDEKEEEEEKMDAEEGKADEAVDEDAWDNENEEEESNEKDEVGNDNKDENRQEKAGHEDDNEAKENEEKDQNDKQEKVPEDDNKRERQDEEFENEEEIEMNDEAYGQNEPPEPEDLDMNGDDEMMGEEDDKDEDADEAPIEEEQRMPDFEDQPDDEKNDENEEEAKEITKNTGGNAGQDESKQEEDEEKMEDQEDELQDQDQQNRKGESKNPVEEQDENKENDTEGVLAEENDKNEEEKGAEEDANKNHENDAMVTDEVDDIKQLPITDDAQDDDNEENVDQISQEFAHSKDKKNTKNALDAMDVDNDEKPQMNDVEDIQDEDEKKREGKSLDMSKLKDAITVDTSTVERNTDTIFGQSNPGLPTATSDDVEMKNIEDFNAITDDAQNSSEDVQKWMKLIHETTELTQNLTEQLRLILDATRATRFKGDYKSGKRINMRKVIPFIASNYRKDKIWLRRTKPSKRDYNVILAVDDSTSMRVNNVNQIVDKSIAIVCQTLSSLEVGKLGVVKFGKESDIVHHLQVSIEL